MTNQPLLLTSPRLQRLLLPLEGIRAEVAHGAAQLQRLQAASPSAAPAAARLLRALELRRLQGLQTQKKPLRLLPSPPHRRRLVRQASVRVLIGRRCSERQALQLLRQRHLRLNQAENRLQMLAGRLRCLARLSSRIALLLPLLAQTLSLQLLGRSQRLRASVALTAHTERWMAMPTVPPRADPSHLLGYQPPALLSPVAPFRPPGCPLQASSLEQAAPGSPVQILRPSLQRMMRAEAPGQPTWRRCCVGPC